MSKASEAKYSLIEGRNTLSDVDYVKHLDTLYSDSSMTGFYVGIVVGILATVLVSDLIEKLVKIVLYITGKA